MSESFAPSSNIADRFLFARLREGGGDRTALRCTGRIWSYGEVAAEAARFAWALTGLGVRREERVLLVLDDGAELVAAIFGVLAIGAVAVPLNPRLELAHLRAVAAGARPRAVVLGEAEGDAATAFADLGDCATITVGAAGRAGDWSVLRDAVPATFDCRAVHLDDPAVWLFSGGTTGVPKAVVQSHGSFANTTERYAVETLGWRGSDVTLSVPKLSFGYALGSNIFFTFRVGGCAVLFAEHPTAERLFELIERHRATILITVPTMVRHMVADPTAGQRDLSSLRFATSAGEALPPALYQRWRETFGVELLDGLGTAEMWHVFVTNRPGEVRPGTLGRVVDGFEIEVRDEDGMRLPAGEVGRMWVRGGSRALGYWQDSVRTAESFRGEWFVGGDLVSLDADGYLTYHGRGDDVLKVGGRWVAPAEVEGCLIEHPAVRECAVVGVANQDGLVKPVAFVDAEGDPGQLERELKAHVMERLAAYKHPRRVIVIEQFPRTHLGKVDRGALRRLAESG